MTDPRRVLAHLEPAAVKARQHEAALVYDRLHFPGPFEAYLRREYGRAWRAQLARKVEWVEVG